jgi:SAM-dependent methyltransferase
MDYRVITRDFEVVTGEEARARLAALNDREFLSEDGGVVAVSRKRWQLAQDAEANGWMALWRNAVEDRNHHHFAMFDRLLMLQQVRFRTALEMGCGPFTNLRLFLSALDIESIELLDPLIDTYRAHPNCTYKDGSFHDDRGGTRPIAALHALPIEDVPPSSRFDLIVLINVIEHCIDVRAVFAKVREMLVPGGMFIFHDKYFEHDQVAAEIATTFDTAHPLKVDRHVVDRFLGEFGTIFSRHITTIGAAPLSGEGSVIYFVGQKL